jgi:L-ascorbate metabolism protein UlaG (beta-lactamase superfamily)
MNVPAEAAVGSALRLTYIGHATVLIELDGVRILTDPVLGARLGLLRRLGPPPDPAGVGAIDAVLISHSHPDHFHGPSLRAIAGRPLVIVPRGLGQSASRDGYRVREVALEDRVELGGVRITAVPARHGRWPRHRDARPLGFLIEGSAGVYFAGDTALYDGMERLAGHVDVALLPVGRWGPPRGPARLSPATAVEAARLVGAEIAIPIHWGTLVVPGFATGRWGWGSLDAGDEFAREAGDRAPELEVRVLRPGQATQITPGPTRRSRPSQRGCQSGGSTSSAS